MTSGEIIVESSAINSVQKISLDHLAQMTGFPLEMIQQELLLSDDEVNQGVSIEELRAKMLTFIDENLV